MSNKEEFLIYCKQEKILKEFISFSCYSDDMLTFEVKRGDVLYELSIITDDTILDSDDVETLIKSNNKVFYFEISKFVNGKRIESLHYKK